MTRSDILLKEMRSVEMKIEYLWSAMDNLSRGSQDYMNALKALDIFRQKRAYLRQEIDSHLISIN